MKFEQLAEYYLGNAAKGYDAGRAKLGKWASEQRIAEDLLAMQPRGSAVIDIPVGTGRFVKTYHRLHLVPTGMDISPDMIAIAAAKAQKIGLNMPLHIADIRSIDAMDGTFDVAICICFLNWIDIRGTREAFSELVRVARKSLIVGIRHYTPVGKLHPATPRGFWQWLLQMAVRFYKILHRDSLRIHEQAEILAMFKQHGLEMKRRFRVVPPKYGTDYFIYLLEKPQ